MNIGNKRGITLVALVITIIILLILAGVSIQVITNTGLLKNAKLAGEKDEEKQTEEKLKMLLNSYKIDEISKGKSLVDFLDEEKNKNTIDDYEDKSEEIDIIKNNYYITVDKNGNIITEIQKYGPRPQVSNVKITLEDGITEVEENSQTIGTKLKIYFDTNMENGIIKTITPELPYITNGIEKNIEFEIVGTVEGVDYTRKVKISLEKKYMKTVESLIKGVSEISQSGYEKISVLTNTEAVSYNTNIFVYKEDIVLDGITDVEGAILINNIYEFGNESTDVATELNNANNMVVLKVEGNLTINEGVTLTACKSENGYGGPKGLMIYCTGTLINNGTISMNARGAKAEGQNVYLWKNLDESYEFVPKNASVTTNRLAGNGGNGGSYARGEGIGYGASATSYSGGTGGGGYYGNYSTFAKNGEENGGAGGTAGSDGGAGAGNPNGGTGGLLIIYANNITAFGEITSTGSNGYYGVYGGRRRFWRWIYKYFL